MSLAAQRTPGELDSVDLTPDPAAEARSRTYALAVGALAVLLVWWSTTSYPIHAAIGMRWEGLHPAAAILVGVGYWSLFGLVGALRSRELDSGAVLTFHMPFVVAGTILGGPVVGGWMGLLSQFERRELTEVPWYGLLGNHGVIAVSAIGAGLAGDGVAIAAAAVGVEPGAVQFGAAATVAFVFAVLNFALVLPVSALRRGESVMEPLRSYDRVFTTTMLAEGLLAWLMALVYVAVGWWAPVACVLLVLLVWDRDDWRARGHRDEMTGLLNHRGIDPLLRAAVQAGKAGRQTNALMVLDLDGFGALNRDHSTLVADEMIVAVGHRLRASVRETDHVARPHRRGDEFWVLVIGLSDPAIASVLAERVGRAICKPLVVRNSDAVVRVGVSIGLVLLDANVPDAAEAIRVADRRMQYAKHHKPGIVAEDPPGDGTSPVRMPENERASADVRVTGGGVSNAAT